MKIDRTKEFQDKIEFELVRFLRRVLIKISSDAVRIIDENKAVAWGEMRRNIREEVIIEAGKILGVVGVGSNVPYAIFRHEGTRPHWPPQIAIQQWVIRKGIIKMENKPITRSRLRSGKKSSVDSATKQIISTAFLIARKISRRGTTGLPFMKMALNQNISWIQGELAKLKIS